MRLLKILETIWLTLAIVFFVAGIYVFATKGWGQAYFMFIITLVSLLMFYIRRRQRKAWSKNKPDGNS